MNLRTDYRKHLIGGIVIAIAALALVVGGPHINQSLLIGLAGTLLAAFVEGYQWVRKEGVPEWPDFLLTAAPAWLAAGGHMVYSIQYPGGL